METRLTFFVVLYTLLFPAISYQLASVKCVADRSRVQPDGNPRGVTTKQWREQGASLVLPYRALAKKKNEKVITAQSVSAPTCGRLNRLWRSQRHPVGSSAPVGDERVFLE